MEQDNVEIKSRYKLSGPNKNDILEHSAGKAVEAEDAELIRLQALLSQWLRMENVSVLMAAGCSVSHDGLPLAKLEKTVLSFLEEHYKAKGKKSANLYAFINKRLPSLKETNPSSFEAWLSYLSNAAFLTSQKESPISDFKWKDGVQLKPNELNTLLNDLRRAIYIWCSLQLPNPGDKTTGHHAFVAKLISRDPSLGRAKVFTLNYDTLIEQALDHLGIHYVDGFVGQAERRFEPSCYGLDMYYPGEVSEGRVRRYDKFIQLYKLHGSIHWWERNDGKDVLASHLSLSPFIEWRAEYQKSKTINNFESIFREELGPVGILPTSNKYIQTLDLPYAHIFRAFHQTLQQPQTFLIVVGYGFGDEHVNRIIEDALINPSFVMLVVDPRPNENMIKRLKEYQQMGARVYLLSPYLESKEILPDSPATFDDFARIVLPNVSWLNDWIKLKKMEQILKRSLNTNTLEKDDNDE